MNIRSTAVRATCILATLLSAPYAHAHVGLNCDISSSTVTGNYTRSPDVSNKSTTAALDIICPLSPMWESSSPPKPYNLYAKVTVKSNGLNTTCRLIKSDSAGNETPSPAVIVSSSTYTDITVGPVSFTNGSLGESAVVKCTLPKVNGGIQAGVIQ